MVDHNVDTMKISRPKIIKFEIARDPYEFDTNLLRTTHRHGGTFVYFGIRFQDQVALGNGLDILSREFRALIHGEIKKHINKAN